MTTTESAAGALLLTVDQARHALGGMARSTIFELIRQGELPSLKIGRRRYIRPEDLAAFIDRLATGAA